MCFIASILKFVYLGALIYSWSIGLHTEQCPRCCNGACGTFFPSQAPQKSSLADSRAHTGSHVLHSRRQMDRWTRGPAFSDVLKRLKENHQVFESLSYQGGWGSTRLDWPPSKGRTKADTIQGAENSGKSGYKSLFYHFLVV